MHGKNSLIHHNNQGIFRGIASPFNATRYHSLIVDPASLPDCLEVTAWTEQAGQQIIMGIKHRDLAIEGVQFHPEAWLTENGLSLLRHFFAFNQHLDLLDQFKT